MEYYKIKRTSEEIDDVLNRCLDQMDKGGSTYPGMTYEDGIREAIDWLTSDNREPLFDD